ncbi:syncollin-like [Danio aesculapii]|uniref:syncollin-like n=1 Tax=Danio aesculapii TaxID=1142201 RepID=UPI0024BFBC14|nr:syncollin-like [Danio aesculapii]
MVSIYISEAERCLFTHQAENMKGLIALLLVALCLEGLNAACPDQATLKDDYGSKLCAQLFEHSSYYYDESCTGSFLYVYPDEDTPIMPWVWENRISSLVVGRGCSLTVWSKSKKKGDKKKFSAGPAYHLKEFKRGLFGNWNDAISGYYCTC